MCCFKKFGGGHKVPKIMLVNLSHTLFSRLFTRDGFAMQALVCLHLTWFRAIEIGMVWFGASYANLR